MTTSTSPRAEKTRGTFRMTCAIRCAIRASHFRYVAFAAAEAVVEEPGAT